jgi:hypothetical protein
MQNYNQLTCDHELVYAYRFLIKNKFIKAILMEKNDEGGWNRKFVPCLPVIIHELLHYVKLNLIK